MRNVYGTFVGILKGTVQLEGYEQVGGAVVA
jgi:hypothetical protein